MSMSSEFVLISAFGRGNWLAVELVEQGHKVSLVDVTEKMGHWSPEDWEGPFGVLTSKRLSFLQKERLVSDEIIIQQPGGITFWLKDRPLELMGPITKYQLDKQRVSLNSHDYISSYDSLNQKQRENRQKELEEDDFSHSWMAYFAHQWSAASMGEFNLGFISEKPLPLFSKFNIRQATRGGMQQSLDWCESKGVKVHRHASIEDIVSERKTVEGFEISGEKSGFLKGDEFIWCLSSEEAMRFKERIWKPLFPQGHVKPEWVWMRYRIRFIQGEEHLVLPNHTVMINNLFLPWTHENLCVLQKTVLDNEIDIWLRVPNTQRANSFYIKQLGQKILLQFRQRMQDADVEISDYPHEIKYNYDELGPSRFPVYDLKSLLALKRVRFMNLHYDGPECWERLDWEGMFEYQELILNDIKENYQSEEMNEELLT